MVIEELDNMGCAHARYVSPEAEVIDVKVQGVLCQSGSTIDGFNPRRDDPSNW